MSIADDLREFLNEHELGTVEKEALGEIVWKMDVYCNDIADLLRRAKISLDWLVPDAKARDDDCRQNLENGNIGGYSEDLTEAIELLAELKRIVS